MQFTAQPESSHAVYSSARTKSLSIYFSQIQVNQKTVQLEPGLPVDSSAQSCQQVNSPAITSTVQPKSGQPEQSLAT